MRNVRTLNNLDISGSINVSGSANVTGSISSSLGITGSFSGSGRLINSLTASNIDNFNQDVGSVFLAGTNITINQIGDQYAISSSGGAGTIYTTGNITGSGTSGDPLNTKDDVTFTTVTASYYTGSGANLDYVDFVPLTTAPTQDRGIVWQDSASYELRQWTEVPNVHIKLGQQVVTRAHNNTGVTIPKGTVVHLTGSNNQPVPRIIAADWTSDYLSANTLGITNNDILQGGEGYVVISGLVEGIDTNGFNSGDILYLSGSGGLSNVKAVAPNHLVIVGQVIRNGNSSVGSVFVKIQNGYEIGELHDVIDSSPQSYDLLVRDTDGLWKNTKILSGSYVFRGQQTITGSLTDAYDASLYIEEPNSNNWSIGIRNLSNTNRNPSQPEADFSMWVENNGDGYLGTENETSLNFYSNANFASPLLILSSSKSYFYTDVEIVGGLSTVLPITSSQGYSGRLYDTASYALDSDKLDGYDSSDFAKLASTNTFTAAENIFNNNVIINGTASIAQLNTVNQQSLLVGDKYITILSGSSTHVQMDGAGILFGSGSTDPTTGDQSSVAHIVYRKGNAPTDFTSDYIEVYPSLRTPGVLSGSNVTGSNTGDETTATIKSKLGTAGVASEGYLTQTDWNTFNNKQNEITLTTTGHTGSATLIGGTLNIPHYIKTIPPISAGEIKRGFFFQNNVTTVTTTNLNVGVPIDTLRAAAVASTTALTRIPSVQVYRGAGPAEGTVGYRISTNSNLWLYNNTSGFRFVCGYAPSDGEGSGMATNNTTKNVNASQFIGMMTGSAALTISSIVSPSSFFSIIGFGSDVGDDYWYFMHNDASGAATKVLLEATPGAGGASFGQANKATGQAFTDFFEFEIYNPPNSEIVYYRAKSHKNNVEVYGSVNTNLPSSTAFLGFQAIRASGGSTVAHSCRISQMFATSLY